ncbi:hypothetical protein Hanom_Chr07g00591471 [Helianthus anomalus]
MGLPHESDSLLSAKRTLDAGDSCPCKTLENALADEGSATNALDEPDIKLPC